MALFDEREVCGHSRFDSLSVEELKEILRQVPLDPEEGDFDPDEIHYISQLVAERDNSPVPYGDAEAFWADFEKKFLNQEDGTRHRIIAEKRRPHGALRVALLVAAICVLLIGSVYAIGILGWIPHWDNDLFGFSKQGEVAPGVDNQESMERFETLEEALAAYDAPPDMVPAYIPEGYVLDGFECYVDALGNVNFDQWYVNDGIYLIWNYVLYTTEFSADYSKDDGDPEVYQFHEIDHYIMSNMDRYMAVWQRGKYECSISGYESREELVKTIESIYMGD